MAIVLSLLFVHKAKYNIVIFVCFIFWFAMSLLYVDLHLGYLKISLYCVPVSITPV